ncbi:uncharacterized protein LOC129779558 [Toxorhynchites rutilus septentrionalis]|uniref:uncharacterized protein LOC129779558 n=1 Tax=Toxorhynchites rutilus septentrionalis TaxID=329112 RepID=UPI00247A0371|nr:uncharacterized protein LOC129779558 [Toxorhynchites rutilus septentrionalis]
MGCLHSTHTMSLEVLAGVPPLTFRFTELSYRFLIRCKIMNPLVIDNFENLLQLTPQSSFMSLYHDFLTHEVHPSPGISNQFCFPYFCNSSVNFDLSMRQKIHGIPDHLRSDSIPPIFSAEYGKVRSDKMFFTVGSFINGSTGFGIFNENSSASFKLKDPCSVYVAELGAIYYALGIIETLPIDHYFIFSDSLSSIEAIRSMKVDKRSSYFLTRIRHLLSVLVEKLFKITLAWVPSHCSIPGNEKADSLAKVGASEGTLFEMQIAYNEFFHIPRQDTLVSWQRIWSEDEFGRWLHTIIPKVSSKAWFKGLNVGRDFIRVISRLMSNHYNLNAHLYRIGLAANNLCDCGDGYHDIEHIVWSCIRFLAARSQLSRALRAKGRQSDIPVRDILGSRDPDLLLHLYLFLRNADVNV